jgi:hypothetical protein
LLNEIFLWSISDEMMGTKFTLMHFSDEDDFLHGIDALQHYNVPISEVHIPRPVQDIDIKLRIRSIKLGYAVLKYGCLGGTALTTLACYLFELGDFSKPEGKPVPALLFTTFIILLTFFLAQRLFPRRVPQIINSRPDNGFLIVAYTRGIVAHEDITRLFQYSRAVEISSTIKNIVTA